MCQEMFFLILTRAISGMPTPEICFLPGSLGQRSCPRSTTASHSVFVNWTYNLAIERRTLYHWAIAFAMKASSPMPRCQGMLWCAVGALLRKQRYEKKNYANLDYLPWFHAKFVHQVLRGVAI